MKVAVGSTNPVKIEAVKLAFKKIWPNKKWEVIGLEIQSGVSSQPKSDQESIKGATNRAKGALKKTKADFGVGIEGGNQKIGSKWFTSGWAIVIDKYGNVGCGSSFRMQMAQKVIELIREGKELGQASDILFKTKNSKQKTGYFGLMTKGTVTRTKAYTDGIISALARFIHPDLY